MESIQEKRRKYANKIEAEEQQLVLLIARNKKSMETLDASCYDTDYINRRIAQLEKTIADAETKIQELKTKKVAVLRHELDDEVLGQYVKAKNSKRQFDITQTPENIERSKKFDSAERSEHKRAYRLQKDIDYNYRHFNRAEESLPDYIRKNIKELPNNKGYKWKGVSFYGERPEERGNKPIILFEKYGNQPLIIHEWSQTHYTRYKKIDQNNKFIECREALKLKN